MTLKSASGKPGPGRRSGGARALGAALLAGSAVLGASAMTQETYVLKYRLEAAGRATAKSAPVTFTLTNGGEDAVRVLPWNTPLTGRIASRMFAVACKTTAGEEALEYRGPMRASSGTAEGPAGKVRGSAPSGDPIRLGPGQSRTATVDLARAYNLPPASECRIEFRGLITILVAPGTGLAEPRYAFAQASGEPLVLHLAATND